MTLNDVYKISKALITIVDGGDSKSFKGTISSAREFIDHYEAMNKKRKV